MSSKVVAPPLCLFDCCGMTDGAAAVILAADEIAKKLTDTPVWILGGTQCVFAADTVNQMGNLSEWPALRRAAKELHDCFTISEIIEYEELGFCKKGEGGGEFVEDGRSYIGGDVAVNPSGAASGTPSAPPASGRLGRF